MPSLPLLLLIGLVLSALSAPPPVDQIPWQTGPSIGDGVAFKDTLNPRGENLFIGYAGYGVGLEASESWVTSLYESSLAARGARYLWAVQGPRDSVYSGSEIGNTELIATLLPLVTKDTKFILTAAHSSGSFVAHELFRQLAGGLDPHGVTAGRVVYFNLDGGRLGLSEAVVSRLRRAYFVSSHDPATRTYSPNFSVMQELGSKYASAGGYLRNEVRDSGCNAGAKWCLHSTLINTRPHDPMLSAPADYTDFEERPVCQAFIDAKAEEAGLTP